MVFAVVGIYNAVIFRVASGIVRKEESQGRYLVI